MWHRLQVEVKNYLTFHVQIVEGLVFARADTTLLSSQQQLADLRQLEVSLTVADKIGGAHPESGRDGSTPTPAVVR